MIKTISSIQNPTIKHFLTLNEKSRLRKKSGEFLIEGEREIFLALAGGYVIKQLIFSEDIFDTSKIADFGLDESQCIHVTAAIYEKLAYRKSTEGVIALAKSRINPLESLEFSTSSPLIVVAEAPEKPGNIGALLRTCDAANVDAVIIANPKTDFYNPNIIRSSVGCLFTNQIASGTTSEIITFLKKNNIAIFCAALQASKSYHLENFTKPSAIVVGTEASGLSNEWLENSDHNIIIPMQGKIDSMNVSVAAGIIIFEAKRQRQFK